VAWALASQQTRMKARGDTPCAVRRQRRRRTRRIKIKIKIRIKIKIKNRAKFAP
jgi:hypothetical protein